MKDFVRSLAALCLLVFCAGEPFAQQITGTWKGELVVQTNHIPLVFRIVRDSVGELAGSFDSPSQHAFDLTCSQVIVRSDSVILMVAMLGARYAGVLSADQKTISGEWFQGNGSLPLTIRKTSENVEADHARRPQTPVPPYAYNAVEVSYTNADQSMHFGGTLTWPTTGGHFPVAILITGSGQQDRNEMLFGHQPFAVIADYLTKRGFAVLRVDDRGIGGTTGNFSEATTLDFVKDVEAGLDFLAKQPQVDKARIGLIGHSEGGLIAPIVATERKDVAFIVLLAGPGIPTIDLITEQVEAATLAEGGTAGQAKANAFQFRAVWEEADRISLQGAAKDRVAVKDEVKKKDEATMRDEATIKDRGEVIIHIRQRIDAWFGGLDPAVLATIKRRDSATATVLIGEMLAQLNTPWYRCFRGLDPGVYLRQLHCKVLALNGSKDVQVIASSNLAGIRASLEKSRSPKYEVVSLPGLNHLFQTCVKCGPSEYGELEESFSARALEVMGDWMEGNVR